MQDHHKEKNNEENLKKNTPAPTEDLRSKPKSGSIERVEEEEPAVKLIKQGNLLQKRQFHESDTPENNDLKQQVKKRKMSETENDI